MALCSIETILIRMIWRKFKDNSAILQKKSRKKELKVKHSLLQESKRRNDYLDFLFIRRWFLRWSFSRSFLRCISSFWVHYFSSEEYSFPFLWKKIVCFRSICFWRFYCPVYISWTVFWTKSRTEDIKYMKGEIEHILSRIKICSFWYFDCYTNRLIILHKESLLCLRNLQSFWLLSVSTWYYTISLRT